MIASQPWLSTTWTARRSASHCRVKAANGPAACGAGSGGIVGTASTAHDHSATPVMTRRAAARMPRQSSRGPSTSAPKEAAVDPPFRRRSRLPTWGNLRSRPACSSGARRDIHHSRPVRSHTAGAAFCDSPRNARRAIEKQDMAKDHKNSREMCPFASPLQLAPSRLQQAGARILCAR